MTEASRAKHKFAVKRNSWPKTRGVAMNPVDHVWLPAGVLVNTTNNRSSLTVVVTINISVKPLQFRGTLHKVKRQVLLLPGELVCCAVPRRLRIKRGDGYGISGNDCGYLARRQNSSRMYLPADALKPRIVMNLVMCLHRESKSVDLIFLSTVFELKSTQELASKLQSCITRATIFLPIYSHH